MKAAIITVSDTRSINDDQSGDRLAGLLKEAGIELTGRLIAKDDLLELRETIFSAVNGAETDLVFTTGGTGFGPRDNTPEATRAVIEREAPGIAEAMRRETQPHHPMAMLSRGVCGIRGKTLIINLPGSPKGVEQCFAVIRPVLEHAVRILKGDTRH